MKKNLKWIIEVLCMIFIFVGIFMLSQPFSFNLYRWGFQVCGIAVGMYIIVSHLPEREEK